MKPLSRYPLLIILLVITLVISVMPSNAAGQQPTPRPNEQQGKQAESYEIYTYQVGNVFTKEDRTAIVQTGADIVEIGADFVLVRATSQEADQIAKLGYPIVQMAQALDFPTADAAYHNYTEMTSEI